MNGDPLLAEGLPEAVRKTLDDFRDEFAVELFLWTLPEDAERVPLYPDPDEVPPYDEVTARPAVHLRRLTPRQGSDLELAVVGRPGPEGEHLATVLHHTLVRTFDFALEIRFFTYELAERYEEINLLYSISETLGSILRLDDAAQVILGEVCDVLGARRGSLWVFDPDGDILRLTASVGEEGLDGPIHVAHPEAVTAQVFREGRPLITRREESGQTLHGVQVGEETDSFLSVPVRYTPPAEEARTVGVINLIGRRRGDRFTASDQKLLSAIASQIGAALENNRLIQESLAQERVTREMELAHNLQMKLLPSAERFEGARVAARVEPAESVGGDFFHLSHLAGGRVGVMIGDVSSHGFPAALIMALSMSAAAIYAAEFGTPSQVLRHLDDALRDELESTEMYLSLFYGVLDPAGGTLTYANAGHPHAFLVREAGGCSRLPALDPPVGIAGPEAYAQREVAWEGAEDLLLLFTDGLSDTLTADGGEKGEARILRAVRENRLGEAHAIVDLLFGLTLSERAVVPADDRTALVLKA